jgi:hypothetical protein
VSDPNNPASADKSPLTGENQGLARNDPKGAFQRRKQGLLELFAALKKRSDLYIQRRD